MAQYDVYRNPNPASRSRIPYLLDVQADLLHSLVIRVVVPLALPEVLDGKAAERLNPLLEVDGRTLVMLTPEIAGIPRKALGERIGNMSAHRGAIVGALDILFTGV